MKPKTPNQRYCVYDKKGKLATSYNLALGSALALKYAKLAAKDLEGEYVLEDVDVALKQDNS
jgi:hypothetical protein